MSTTPADLITAAETEHAKATKYLDDCRARARDAEEQWGRACEKQDPSAIEKARHRLRTTQTAQFDAKRRLWTAEDQFQNAKDRADLAAREAACPWLSSTASH